MANVIPGINTRIRPGVVVQQKVKQNVAVVPGGARTALIMGEGLTEETVVASANGLGADGLSPTFSGTSNQDGRHFQLAQTDLVPNRTRIIRNGIDLTVLEAPISAGPFDSRFGVRLEPDTGRIQLQGSALVDQGAPESNAGEPVYVKTFTSNAGNGTIDDLALINSNAPAETWVIRCTSVVPSADPNIPVSGNATFMAAGSVSGIVRDQNGSPIAWRSDGNTVDNGILSFSITEGGSPFKKGDKFVVEVQSGVLTSGDRLEARYIPNSFINDPETFSDTTSLFAKHGQPSATNTLSLGAAMAFENGASQIVCLQCRPALPRRTSYMALSADNPLSDQTEGATGNSDAEDTIFPLPPGALPDTDSDVHIFVVDPDGTENQAVLQKVAFYDDAFASIQGTYTDFVSDSQYANSYTVVSLPQTEQEGRDGYLYTEGGNRYFKSNSIRLRADRTDPGESDLNKFLYVYNLSDDSIGRYQIAAIGDGLGDNSFARLTPANTGAFTDQADYLEGAGNLWQVVDEADRSAYLALGQQFVDNNMTSGKGLRVTYVETRDADFFDTNWEQAYAAAESADVQFVVPLPTQSISNIFAVGKSHVLTQSDLINAHERILVIGAINGLAPNNVSGAEDVAVEDIGVIEGIQGDSEAELQAFLDEDVANYGVATAFGDTQRVIYMYPDQIIRTIGASNVVLSGYFAAAAMAGFLSGKAFIADPPTNKTLAGFTIPRSRTFKPSVINSLLSSGVCILEPVQGGGRIVHGLTTAQSGAPEDEEISIVEIRDQCTRILRNSLRPFIGRVNTPTLLAAISSAVDKIMGSMVSTGLLTGFSNITVVRNPAEPRQVDISVKAFPAGPLNWIYAEIEFSMGG